MPAGAAIDGVNETIASATNTVFVFVADWFPGGELAVEQDHIDYVFIDLRGRDFRGLKCYSVPPRRCPATQGDTLILLFLSLLLLLLLLLFLLLSSSSLSSLASSAVVIFRMLCSGARDIVVRSLRRRAEPGVPLQD